MRVQADNRQEDIDQRNDVRRVKLSDGRSAHVADNQLPRELCRSTAAAEQEDAGIL